MTTEITDEQVATAGLLRQIFAGEAVQRGIEV